MYFSLEKVSQIFTNVEKNLRKDQKKLLFALSLCTCLKQILTERYELSYYFLTLQIESFARFL